MSWAGLNDGFLFACWLSIVQNSKHGVASWLWYHAMPDVVLQASLSEMIPPGCLVMLTPVVVGVLFGTRTLAGVLAGALVSGVQMAVSMSNTGGAWDNAKKYVEVSKSLLSHMCQCPCCAGQAHTTRTPCVTAGLS